ncbi:hypothetical protein A5664_01730 [Mycolicibacterium fortuitum]|nr:hypothetical protein A5664_01730 [Mycolicibacterium fortuitum]
MVFNVAERFVFQDLDNGWTAEMAWREGEYEGGPAGVWIRPTDDDSPPSEGISNTVLSRIDFDEAKAKLRENLEKHPYGWRGSPEQQAKREAQRFDRLRYELGKGPSSPEYLSLLAANYVRLVSERQPKPVEYLAENLGRPLQTVRGHLWQARKKGLLDGSPGRKGGDLTPEAMKILQNMPHQMPSLTRADPPAGVEDARDR